MDSVYFVEIFYSVCCIQMPIRVLLPMVACMYMELDTNMELDYLDMKTTFLDGELEENILMIQLESFVVLGMEGYMCRLMKSLYGLK